MQKPVDLQLSADEFITHYADDCSVSFNNFSHGITASDVDNIELSLGLNGGLFKSGASSSQVTDLEDPNFGVHSSKDEHKLEKFLHNGLNHIRYRSCLNQTSGNCKPMNPDLNMVQFEYSSCLSNNFSVVRNPSRKRGVTSSSLTCLNKANAINLSGFSDKHRLLDLNIELTTEGGSNKGGICVIDLDSDSSELCSSNKSNPRIESVDSSSKLVNNLACKLDCVDAEPRAQNQVAAEEHPKPCESTESDILEADERAQKAAESLMRISSEARVFPQPHPQPQCSSDSYEKMVLWAKESDPDDLCISSNAFVVDGSDDKVSGYKLKRGTRMKDFQRDVLPSLSILSWHEINEDVNVLEGVIRSRDYRKMKAKMRDDGEWFRAGRSKRSRAGYNRRYHQ